MKTPRFCEKKKLRKKLVGSGSRTNEVEIYRLYWGMSDTTTIRTPSWDDQTELAPIYTIKFKAMVEYRDAWEALASEAGVIITADHTKTRQDDIYV